MHSSYGLVQICYSLKNLHMVSYSKLHAKSCDHLYKGVERNPNFAEKKAEKSPGNEVVKTCSAAAELG